MHTLRTSDRVAVKPHASPIFHAIQYMLGVQTRGHRRVRRERLAEGRAAVGRGQGVALHDTVGLVARHAGAGEREQHALRMHEAAARIEIARHALDVHAQTFNDIGEIVRHVVRRQERVRQDDALDRGMTDVALMPQRLILETGDRVATQQARETGDSLAAHRIALVRHRRGTLLLLGERLLGLAHLGAHEVTDLGRDLVHGAPEHRDRTQERGMTIALHDLIGDGLRFEAE